MSRRRALSKEDATELRWLYHKGRGWTIHKLAKAFNISIATVSRILDRRSPYDKDPGILDDSKFL